MSNLPSISDGSSSESDLIVRGKRVVTPHGESAVAIHVRRGVITMVSGFDDVRPGSLIYEAGDFVVMPGLVDTHVHINEPGRTDRKSTRLNSSHQIISYAVFCLKKKKNT